MPTTGNNILFNQGISWKELKLKFTKMFFILLVVPSKVETVSNSYEHDCILRQEERIVAHNT